MPFDPTQPFTVVSYAPAPFDPSKPFTPVSSLTPFPTKQFSSATYQQPQGSTATIEAPENVPDFTQEPVQQRAQQYKANVAQQFNTGAATEAGITPQNVQELSDYVKKNVSPAIVPPLGRIAGTAAAKTGAGFLDWITSPSGLAQTGLAALPPTRIPMAIQFIQDSAKGGSQAASDAIDAYQKGDIQGAADNVANVVASLGTAFGVGHAALREISPTKPVQPSLTPERSILPSGQLKSFPEAPVKPEQPLNRFPLDVSQQAKLEKAVPEKIVSAAVKTPQGVLTGPNHPAILQKEGLPVPPPEQRNTPNFGFTTDKGRFITREEAARLAKANGQNLKEFETNEPAHSHEIAKAGTTTPIAETKQPVIPPVPKGQKLVTIQKKDGTTEPAVVNEPLKYWSHPTKGQIPAVGRLVNVKWSHGMLGDGEKIIDESAPKPVSNKTVIPVKQKVEQPVEQPSKSLKPSMAGPGSPSITQGPDVTAPGEGAEGQIYGVSQKAREQRAASGQVPEIGPGKGTTGEETVERGRQLLRQGFDAPAALSHFEKTAQISPDAAMAIRAYGEQLAQKMVHAEKTFGTTSPQFIDTYQEMAEWDKRTKPIATRAHELFISFQGVTDIDTGTYSGLAREHKATTGRDFTPKQEGQAKEIAGKVSKAKEDAQKAQEKLYTALDQPLGPHVKSITDRIISALDKSANDAFARIKARRAEGRLFTGIDPTELADYTIYGAAKIAKGFTEFSKWSAEMVKDLGDYIKPHLQQIWDGSDKELDNRIAQSVKPKLRATVKKAVRRESVPATKEGIQKAFADHQPGKPFSLEQVQTLWKYARQTYVDNGNGDYRELLENLSIDTGLSKEEIARALQTPKGAKRLTDEMYYKQSLRRQAVQSAKNWLRNQQYPGWLRFIRAIPRVFFIDKIFGHGTVGMITHAGLNVFNPRAWSKWFPAFIKQFQFVFSPVAHEKWAQDITHRPNYIIARRAGLANDPFRYADDYQNAAIKTFLGKLGGLVGNRGFDALKEFRQTRFDQTWNSLPQSLKTKQMAELLADSINHATGIVKSHFGEWAGWTFFAPKLEASRWAWLIGDTAKTAKTFKEWETASPEQKYAALADVKQKAAIVGTYFGLLMLNQGILSLTDSKQKINWTNPRKSDFLQFKIAGHTVGVVSPILGIARLFANLLHDSMGQRGRVESLEPRRSQIESDLGSYARGKLSPVASFATDIASQSDFQGRPLPWSSDRTPAYLRRGGLGPYTYGEYAAQQFAPIPLEQIAPAILVSVKSVWTDQGIPPEQQKSLLNGLITAVLEGSTGIRYSKDYSDK